MHLSNKLGAVAMSRHIKNYYHDSIASIYKACFTYLSLNYYGTILKKILSILGNTFVPNPFDKNIIYS